MLAGSKVNLVYVWSVYSDRHRLYSAGHPDVAVPSKS